MKNLKVRILSDDEINEKATIDGKLDVVTLANLILTNELNKRLNNNNKI